MLNFGVMKGNAEKHNFDLKSYMDNEQLPRAKTKQCRKAQDNMYVTYNN